MSTPHPHPQAYIHSCQAQLTRQLTRITPHAPVPDRLGNLTALQQHSPEMIKKELHDEGVFFPEHMDDSTLLR